jgi:GntR family transcriptional regulator
MIRMGVELSVPDCLTRLPHPCISLTQALKSIFPSPGYSSEDRKSSVDNACNCIIVLIQMIIRVQPGIGTAIYLQIESQLKHAIAAGALKRDDALPPVRKLAAELRINPNTVARAYQNLERDGILRTVPGGGCYVNGQSPGLLKSEKLRRLKPLATQLAVEAKQLRLSREELVQLLENSFDELGEAP